MHTNMAIKIFAMVGILVAITIVVMLFVAVGNFVKEKIEIWVWKQKIKRSYLKHPTAKCFCRDCKYHSKSRWCGRFNDRNTADFWFCSEADPKKESLIDEVESE